MCPRNLEKALLAGMLQDLGEASAHERFGHPAFAIRCNYHQKRSKWQSRCIGGYAPHDNCFTGLLDTKPARPEWNEKIIRHVRFGFVYFIDEKNGPCRFRGFPGFGRDLALPSPMMLSLRTSPIERFPQNPWEHVSGCVVGLCSIAN